MNEAQTLAHANAFIMLADRNGFTDVKRFGVKQGGHGVTASWHGKSYAFKATTAGMIVMAKMADGVAVKTVRCEVKSDFDNAGKVFNEFMAGRSGML